MYPGDMLVWDSRMMHCNHFDPGSTWQIGATEVALAAEPMLRAAPLVCMTPKHKAPPDVLQRRLELARRVWVC